MLVIKQDMSQFNSSEIKNVNGKQLALKFISQILLKLQVQDLNTFLYVMLQNLKWLKIFSFNDLCNSECV